MKIPKKVAAPVPPPAPAAKKQASAPAVPTDKRNIGVTSGMRIMQYQDLTMQQQLKRKLTDEELGQDWAREFPNARAQFAERMDIVRIVRKLFNERRHGNQQLFSDTLIPKYEIVNGKRVAVEEKVTKRGAAAKADLAKAS